MRPVSVTPVDPLAALVRLRDNLHLMPGVSPVDAIWLRDGLAAYLQGDSPTVDMALGLNGNTRRTRAARVRQQAIRCLAMAIGGGPTWSCASQVLTVITGSTPAPPGQERTAQLLRGDKQCPRSIEHIYRLIKPSTDMGDGSLHQWLMSR